MKMSVRAVIFDKDGVAKFEKWNIANNETVLNAVYEAKQRSL